MWCVLEREDVTLPAALTSLAACIRGCTTESRPIDVGRGDAEHTIMMSIQV